MMIIITGEFTLLFTSISGHMRTHQQCKRKMSCLLPVATNFDSVLCRFLLSLWPKKYANMQTFWTVKQESDSYQNYR